MSILNIKNTALVLVLALIIIPETTKQYDHNKPLFKVKHLPATNKEKTNEVPILCYHQIRDWESSDSKSSRTYILSRAKFQKQLTLLKDSGFHFILPHQLYYYYKNSVALPDKPVMITFDDATASQLNNALPELNKVNAKAVFFVMTVVVGKPKYMSVAQIKHLSEQGHTIGCHTWDHHDVRYYTKNDWKIQLTESKALLEKMTGKMVDCFAYPFGSWSPNAFPYLTADSIKTAYQLTGKQDTEYPLLTIRRILVDGNWNERQFMQAISRF